MLQLIVTLEGALLVEGEPAGREERALATARAEGGAGRLLRLLGTELLTAELAQPWRWLRDFARLYFRRLCQGLPPLADPPPAAELAHWRAGAPWFQGCDRLDHTLATAWWRALAEDVNQAVEAQPGGLRAWLREANPLWHLVGRVTFHLAENPADGTRPFAFLATFTDRIGGGGQVQHLPLGRALQLHTAAGDQAALASLLEPVRSAAAVSGWLRDRLADRGLFQPRTLTATEAWQFLQESEVLREHGIVLKLPDWWSGGRPSRAVVRVTIEGPRKASLSARALLGFRAAAALDGEPLTREEWEQVLAAGTGLVSLRGKWVEVNAGQIQQVLRHWERVENLTGEGGVSLLEAMRWLAGMPPRPVEQECGLPAGAADWSEVAADGALENLLERLRTPPDEEPPPGLRATLRPYQRRGLAWLRSLTGLGFGACLADDMGLGKTVQVIALLLARKEEARSFSPAPGPSLLVAPASLIGNWRAELERFAPGLSVLTGHPSAMERAELERALADPARALAGHDALLTTYQMLRRAEAWQRQHWDMVVLDEAQAVKNPASQAARVVKSLEARARVALTGTPVENQAGDLWSLFDFLNPGLLGGAGDFAAAVKACSTRSAGFAPLRRLVAPFILRRMKTDRSIIEDLPEKIEMKAWCGLTRRQTRIYAKLVDQLALLLRDDTLEPARRQGVVLGFLLKFKQVCNHPSHWNGDGRWDPADSGKFARLGEIAAGVAANRERALVFTQFQETCAPLAAHLASVFGREGLVLHGGTPVGRRAGMVERFQAPDGPPFMVISVKAGGTGLNLTAASQVIHFDRWWNPAVENQATDRAFRIGQRRAVVVHKLVCQGTIEERIDRLIEEKTALAGEFVGGGGAESWLSEMSRDELLDLVTLDIRCALE
jgi:hypothetical protein